MLFKEERTFMSGVEIITRKQLGEFDITEEMIKKINSLADIQGYKSAEHYLEFLLSNEEGALSKEDAEVHKNKMK